MNEYLQKQKQLVFDPIIRYLDANPEIKLYLLFALLIVGVIFITHFLYISYRGLMDKRRKTTGIRIRFPIPQDEDQEKAQIEKMNDFFSSCYSILNGKRMSLEVHKISKYIDVYIYCTSTSAIETIKKYLTSIERISIQDIEIDPLDSYISDGKAKGVSIKRLNLRKAFEPISHNHTQTFSGICNYLSSLKEDEKGGIIFILRPSSDKTSRIQRIIRLNTNQYNEKPKLRAIKEEANKGLMIKSGYKMYFGNVYTIGKGSGKRNSSTISKALSGHLKGSHGLNTFSSQPILFSGRVIKILKKRYVSFEHLYVKFFRSFFGSYLTSKELALLFHPSQIQRGSYGTNRSTILESSPEFTTKKDGSCLVGSSYLKTGEKKEIYLPSSSRRRHSYALGSTGSGKSTTLINTALSVIEENKSSLIFFDPNGMDIKNIMRRLDKKTLMERVVYIDPSLGMVTNGAGETVNYNITINPFMRGFKASKTEKDALTESILDIFEKNAKDGDLGVSIKRLLKIIISTGVWFPDYYFKYLMEEKGLSEEEAQSLVYDKQITMADIPYILNRDYGFLELLDEIFHKGEDNIALTWQNQIKSMKVSQMVLDGIDNRLANITTDSILPILEGSKFNVSQLVKEKKIILIPNTEPLFGIKGKRLLPQLMMTELWAELQREQNPENKEKVVVIIDEVEEVQLPIIVTMLAQARKYGLSLFLANQYLFQLQEWFTKAILGNVANLFIFKMRNKDEVRYVTPMFQGQVTELDITGLEKFQGYLTTLNNDSRGSNILSFETIDYNGNYPEKATDKHIQELAQKSMETYGQSTRSIEKARKEKLQEGVGWFGV